MTRHANDDRPDSDDHRASALRAGSDPLFGTDAKPPAHVLVVAALQHTLAMLPGVVLVPLIIAKAAEIGTADAARFINMAILVSGLATLLQVNRLGPLGCGYLCVMGSSGVFIQPAVIAGKAGGLPLVFGMTLLLSPVEAILSRFTGLLRRLAPAHVTGTIIMLIGLTLVPVCITELGGGRGAGDFGGWRHLLVGGLTIVVTAFAAASPYPVRRLASVILGIVVGCGVSAILGMVDVQPIQDSPLVTLPRPAWAGWAFDWQYALPFAIAYIVTSLESYGDMHALAAICEGREKDVDEGRVRGGLLADAAGSALAGLFGTSANTSFSGNIALVHLTGVASRRVGVCVGGLLIALSFTPKLAAAASMMPHAVVGGAMAVSLAILVTIGMRMALQGEPDNGKLLVVGVSLMVGLGVQSVPAICAAFPQQLQILFRSGTCTGALCAMVLNLLLGVTRDP